MTIENILFYNNFNTMFLTFGIMAPTALQRASFQKNCCTYARSVMYAKTSDIENNTFHV
jgi:hypothetical protein